MIIDFKLYELANKSFSLFSDGMQKRMKSLLKTWRHPVRNGYLTTPVLVLRTVIEIKRFFILWRISFCRFKATKVQ